MGKIGGIKVKLKNKIAVVTGASRGIGKGVSLMFAEEGADIVCVAKSDNEHLEKTKKEIELIGRKVIIINADVSKKDEVDKIFTETEEKFGGINILVNSAGILGKMDYAINQTEEDWDHVMGTNAKGVFLCSTAAAKLMIKNIKAGKQEGGKIINISSIVGRTGWPLCSVYSPSKFAVIGFTQALAAELAEYKINVNAICPGTTNTDMQIDEFTQVGKIYGKTRVEALKEAIDEIPLKESNEPIDIAYLAVYFASEESRLVTGQSLNVCGGLLMK